MIFCIIIIDIALCLGILSFIACGTYLFVVGGEVMNYVCGSVFFIFAMIGIVFVVFATRNEIRDIKMLQKFNKKKKIKKENNNEMY